ncbi:hypothetical protein VB566_06205 [Clostridium perfringens]|uniref:hypothetical protein n=1 Tax=Clostridium perfringens TaxID=1502 RepID=UPI001A1F7D1F|nr:hypothetical protein [Clostridium perfringens]MDH5097593.1 hypothetical protein [Clostridium perfringens]MEA5270181.1 hypothetical protein [Clostridium perfringens]MEA5310482.1 hypothetical protein [Clostridium perfringens]MEA5340690.1 hypothetical protein [Clostridium perfringens]HAT4142885.1 hypothetical protein [Clostridium perfringens]
MATNKGFTKIDNSIITSEILSNNAKLIYMQIKYYSTIPNFKLCKITLKRVSNLGEKLFLKAIKELKTLGIIEQRNDRKGKQNFFYYALVEQNEVKEEAPKKVTKKVAKKEVAPKVENVIDGQIEIDEAMESVKNDDIENIANKCVEEGLNVSKVEIEKALNITNEKSPKNPIAYTLGVLRNMINNRKSNVNQGFKKSLSHMNFSQREYNWESLENELLGYGLNDSVNELDSVPQLPSFIGSSL